MYWAIGVEPTNEMLLTSGFSSRPSTASLSPWTTLKTPSGRPAFFHSSATYMIADGSFSLGLTTTVLPAAIAIGKNHIGTMAGKLNGEMMPTTPSGWRIEYDVDAGRDALGEAALHAGAGCRRRTRRPPGRG